MTPVLVIGLLATLLISFFIAIPLFVNWRNKRGRILEFERLLDNINDRQNARIDKLTQRFTGRHKLNQADAQKLTQRLIVAEKLFLQQFIDQQLQQESVEHFYEQLCELLDNYLNSLPPHQAITPNTPADSTAHQEIDHNAENSGP